MPSSTSEAPTATHPGFVAPVVVWRRADTLIQQKKQKEAYDLLLQGEAQFKDHPEIVRRLADIELQNGRGADARKRLEGVMARIRRVPGFLHALAVRAGQATGDSAWAEERLRVGLREAPNDPELQLFMGNSLFARQKYAAALPYMERAVNLRARHLAAMVGLGRVLEQLEQYDRAERVLRAAREVDATSPTVLLNLGNVLQRTNKYEESLGAYRDYARRAGLPPFLFTNMGAVLRKMSRYEEALRAYDVALALDPANGGAWYNRSNLLKEMGDLDASVRSVRRAITLSPNDGTLHWNLSLALLAGGHVREGFAEYEWRWQHKNFPSRRRDFTQPMWDGRPFEGKTLLVHTEQGVGDVLQFLRFLPAIKARGGRIVLECHAPLMKLLGGMNCFDEMIERFASPPPFDLHLPLLSAPYVLGMETLDDIRTDGPYLAPPPDARFDIPEARPDMLKVGFIWGGNPQFAGDLQRSAKLDYYMPLFDIEGVQFFSLQKGDREPELVGAPPGVVRLSDRITDFCDTAVAMERMDLVITTCTSTAHLAGALARPTWVLLHHAPDWRWLQGRRDNPWYPTARAFMQERAGDWEGVFAKVGGALRELVAERRR